MIVNFTIYILLFAYALLLPKNKKLWWVVVLGFSFFVGYRALSVGTDTGTYDIIYSQIAAHGYGDYPEWLYGYSCQFFSSLGFNFQEFQFTMTALCLSLVAYVVCKDSPYPGMSAFILYAMYFIFYLMNANRQMMGCFVLLLAYHFYLLGGWKNLIIFFALVFLAAGFHHACYVAVLIPFAKYLPLHRSTVVLLLIASLIFGILVPTTLVASLSGDYGNYAMIQAEHAGERTGLRVILAVFMCIYWTLIFLFVYFTCEPASMRQSKIFHMYYLGILVNNALLRQEQGLRVMLFYSILNLIVLPLYLQYTTLKSRTARTLLMLILSIFFFTFLLSDSADVLHYHFIWEKVSTHLRLAY